MNGAGRQRNVPSQEGRCFVVTGGNSGLGYESARVLAQRGARVILACRRPDAGEAAAGRIRALAPAAVVEVAPLDLADLASVAACARRVADRLDGRLDGLVNNAGLMGVPRALTVDGFERQFGVNHLGHFALTGRLLPCLLASPQPRVVTVTSETRPLRADRLRRPPGERRYRRWRAYAQAKLANLLFALELDRLARLAGSALRSLAAHPGYARTGLQGDPERHLRAPSRRLWAWANHLIAQDAAAGAWPSLRAATDPDAPGGALYGPKRAPQRTRGRPGPATCALGTTRRHAGSGTLRERLTAVTFPW